MDICGDFIVYQYLPVGVFLHTTGNLKARHRNDSKHVLIVKSCSGKFTCALLGMSKAWRHRNGIRGRNTGCGQTDKLLPKDGMSVKAGGRFGLMLLTHFLVSSTGRFTDLVIPSPLITGY